MAITYGFYNAVNHDRLYDAVQMGQIFDGIISDGVYATYKKAMIVIASSNNSEVIVQPGRAWFNHTWTYNDANLPVTAPDPEVLLERIDALVLDINSDLSYRENKLVWVQGTPSSMNPTKPTLTHTENHNQYALCYVHRYGDTYQIRQQDITNAIGTSETPFVTGVIDTVDIDDLVLQWTNQFNNYIVTKQNEFSAFQTMMTNTINQYMQDMEADFFEFTETQKAGWEQWLADNRTAWNNWFSHIQTELDGDVAGNLQNQIDRISFIYVTSETLFLPMTAVSVIEEDEKAIFVNLNNG